ncbi:MAG: hypothetical protein LBC70_03755 [Chitinispirillales bacterium]|jgi:hypothetical protein|nr:hypothetical protein [Chitinispirillales bacterium]
MGNLDEIRALLAETAKYNAETARLYTEHAKWHAKEDKQRAERNVEEDRRRTESDRKHAEAMVRADKLSAQINATRDVVNGISKSNNLVTENYFYESIYENNMFGGIHYDDIRTNMHSIKKMPDKTRLEGEYDLILINDTSICLIETKYRVRSKDIDNLVNKHVVNFKILFPDFADYNYYLGIAGWSFDEDSEAKARSLGIGILKLKGDAVVINDDNLKVF